MTYATSSDARALNLQPLQPRFTSRLDWYLLNPQPLPPRELYR
jgi:hypothetical protein